MNLFQGSIILLLLAAHQSDQAPTEKPKDAQSKSDETELLAVPNVTYEPISSSGPEEPAYRQNRMFNNFFDYYNTPYYPYYNAPQPAYYPYPYPYYNDFDQYNDIQADDEDEDDFELDIASRANMHKRRPGSSHRKKYQDSQIFYIRLPPTPYMFVPGSGYVSQPPTFNPLMPMAPPVAPVAPQIPSMPVSPFISIPLNFVSNARPTSIIHFGGSPQPQFPMAQPQFPMAQPVGMPSPFGIPNIPSFQHQQRPQRPHRPRPKPFITADSEITQLKGQYLFNGRPNQIYLLTNSQPTPMYSNRINPYY